jgi:hypothetical protein
MNMMNRNLVSPARQLAQRARDLREQREAREHYGEAPTAEAEDIARASQIAGPTPTLLNMTTGEWGAVDPYQARTMGVPVGPPNPAILNRMWRGEPLNPLPLYGSDLMRT